MRASSITSKWVTGFRSPSNGARKFEPVKRVAGLVVETQHDRFTRFGRTWPNVKLSIIASPAAQQGSNTPQQNSSPREPQTNPNTPAPPATSPASQSPKTLSDGASPELLSSASFKFWLFARKHAAADP